MTIYEFIELLYSDIESAKNFVLSNKCILNARTRIGETAFHYWVIENETELVKLLFEWGSDIDSQDDFGETPLMSSLFLKHDDLSEWLIECGADLELKTESNETALSYAVLKGNERLSNKILSKCTMDIQYYFENCDACEIVENPNSDIKQTLVQMGLKNPF